MHYMLHVDHMSHSVDGSFACLLSLTETGELGYRRHLKLKSCIVGLEIVLSEIKCNTALIIWVDLCPFPSSCIEIYLEKVVLITRENIKGFI